MCIRDSNNIAKDSFCFLLSPFQRKLVSECYVNQAKKTNNTAYCAKASYDHDQCYLDLAVKNQDYTFCLSIQYNGPSDCITKASKNISDCSDKRLNKDEQDACLSFYAQKDHNLSICDQLNYDHHKETCYYALALLKNNQSICRQRQLQKNENLDRDREECVKNVYNKVADEAITKKDPSLCSQVYSRGYGKQECLNNYYNRFGPISGDLEMCNDIIGNQELLQSCRRQAQEYRYESIGQEAVDNHDSDICNKLNDDPFGKQKCLNAYYFNFGAAYLLPGICDKIIGDDSLKNSCLWYATGEYKKFN